jgi:urease subunit gamma/beta
MRLTPQERDRLLIFSAAQLARARRARGLLLNVPETIALVADAVIEAARDGARLAAAVDAGRRVLGPRDVLPGVPEVVTEVRVEAVFDDGTRLAVVPDPVGGRQSCALAPGEVITAEVADDPAQDVVTVTVRNTSDVAVSVTSHWHFFEANPRLRFDRARAYGRHLDVPAGSAVRFDPGVEVAVDLVPIGGKRVAVGFAGLVDGPLDEPGGLAAALARARSFGYLGAEATDGADGVGGAERADGAGRGALG